MNTSPPVFIDLSMDEQVIFIKKPSYFPRKTVTEKFANAK